MVSTATVAVKQVVLTTTADATCKDSRIPTKRPAQQAPVHAASSPVLYKFRARSESLAFEALH